LSSSAIGNIYVRGLSGPDGNPGNTGNTGNTGSTGSTGNTGSLGAYYTGYVFNGNSVTITLSNGTTFELTGTFKGATTLDKGIGVATGSNTGSGQILLSTVAGGTFLFKGLCAYGSLRASYTGANNEYISIDSIYFGTNQLGNFDPTTLSARELTYLSTKVLAAGADLTHRTDLGVAGVCGAFDFAYTTYGGASSDTSNHLNTSSKILNLGPIPIGRVSGLTSTNVIVPNGFGTTLGVFLDAGAAGTFVCKTPIGIQGITGPFKKNEVASISILIDSDNVWKFPSNVYFEPDQNYLSCGKNLIGLFTYDGGETWIASVSHRGHGIFNPRYQCIPGYLYGSCCYQTASGRLTCDDYVTRQQCDNVFGIFHPGMPCQEACGNDVSVCCTNGKCTENISITECESFGGSYWAGYTCGFATGTLNYPEGELNETELKADGRFCYDNCNPDDVAVCCKNGQCLGNYTRVQCELILGGRSVNASSCDGVDCCDYTPTDAACCICRTDPETGSVTSTCQFLSYQECNATGGNYMGPGKQCNDVACGCICGDTVTQPTGTCCKGIQCLGDDYTLVECDSEDGSWTSGGNCSNCQSSGSGICCKNGTCTTAINQTECTNSGGHWISSISIQNRGCTSSQSSNPDIPNLLNCPGDIFTYNFGQNTNAECEICSMYRPVFWMPSEEYFYGLNGLSGCNWNESVGGNAYKLLPEEIIIDKSPDETVWEWFKGLKYPIDQSYNCRIRDDGTSADLLFNHMGHKYVIDGYEFNTPQDLLNEIIKTFDYTSDVELVKKRTYDTLRSYYIYLFKPPYFASVPDCGQFAGNDLITLKSWDDYIKAHLRHCLSGCFACFEECKCPPIGNPNGGGAVYSGKQPIVWQGSLESDNFSDALLLGTSICDNGEPVVETTVDCDLSPCTECSPCSSDVVGNPDEGVPYVQRTFSIQTWTDWGENKEISPECASQSSLKNIKVTINNQEIHLPILCDGKCDDFETVD
jgi:hypothetical protein